VEAYEDYVAEWPDGDQVDAATRRTDELRWEAADAVGTVDAYRDYLAAEPDGAFRSFAALRIEELEFVDALGEGTPEALEAFVTRHRDSRLAAQARDLLDRLHYGAAAVADTSQDYGRYLLVHPEGDFAEDARVDRARAAFEEARATGTMTAWLGFLNNHAAGDLADAARQEMEALRFSDVALVVVLRASARPPDQWPAGAATLAQRVDFTLGNALRDIGFHVSVADVVMVDAGEAPSAPSTWQDGTSGVLVVDVWESAYAVRWSAVPSTRLQARMALYTPSAGVPVWKDLLTASSSIVSVLDTEAQLRQSSVDNLAAALGRTTLPVAPYLRVRSARR
jgi:hypothetical protein